MWLGFTWYLLINNCSLYLYNSSNPLSELSKLFHFNFLSIMILSRKQLAINIYYNFEMVMANNTRSTIQRLRKSKKYFQTLREVLTQKKKCEISHLGGGQDKIGSFSHFFFFFFFHVLNHANLQRKFFLVGGRVPLTWKSTFLGHIREKPCNFL